MASAVVTPTLAPPVAQRASAPPATGLFYVIEGRSGWRTSDIEAACTEAGDLCRRLRLSTRLNVRVAGSEVIVASAGRDANGCVTVVRYEVSHA